MVQSSSRQGTSKNQEKITQDRILRQANIKGNGRHRTKTRTRLEGPRADRLVQKTSQRMERLRRSSVLGNPSNNRETYRDYRQQDGLGLFRKEFREAPGRVQIATRHTSLQRSGSSAQK